MENEIELEKTIQLRKPITLGGVVYDKLELREPTAGELEESSKATTSLGMVISLIQIVAKVPKSVARGLCQRDMQEANDFLASFGKDSQRIGETQ